MESALLTKTEFDAHVASKTLRLSFVGMSNCGKSYRSKVLERECGFFWYQVDGDILNELGFKDEAEISAWLGYPTSPTYSERERRYIELENEFTGKAAMASPGKNLVFDTTGSVIHLDPATLAALRENTLVVHLDVGEESLDMLIAKFFEKPKPVAWSGYFSQAAGESEMEALRRSYPALLAERLERYRALAHVEIPARDMRDKSGVETLGLIRNKLK